MLMGTRDQTKSGKDGKPRKSIEVILWGAGMFPGSEARLKL